MNSKGEKDKSQHSTGGEIARPKERKQSLGEPMADQVRMKKYRVSEVVESQKSATVLTVEQR